MDEDKTLSQETSVTEHIEVLRRLQSIDTRLKRLEDDKSYSREDVEKKQGDIQRKKSELSKLGEGIKAFQKSIHSKELDLKSLESEIQKLRIKMNQLKTNKEYAAMKIEIGGKEADKSRLEDELLNMFSRLEETQQRYATFEKEIAQEEHRLEELKKKVEVTLKAIGEEITDLKKRREEYTKLLTSDIVQQYNRLIRHKDAKAVVGVVDGACQGCYMSVTPQTINLLMSRREITFCHSCGRILYLADGEE